ncbi:MAG: NYN domain-containing protein [Pseudoclavibacter sp.]|nr:NYN domain-containing protein [Pseudoclavibacter sp.]
MPPAAQRIALVIDYQNLHLTAADVFLQHRPVEEALIHPVRFGRELARVKSEANERNGYPPVRLERIEVYRGLPSSEYDHKQYARNLAQRSQWRKDAAVHGIELAVVHRPLRYHYTWSSDGRRVYDPGRRPQEKGVDVLCALALTRLARSGDYQAVVLASRDTDLVPALEEAHREGGRVEAVKWFRKEVPETRGSLKPQSFSLWTTSLDEKSFRRSLDENEY